MAEPLPTALATLQTPTSRAERQSRFTFEEDLTMLHEVAAANANLAAFGESRQRFAKAAEKMNANAKVQQKVTCNIVRNRYKRMQEQFDREDSFHQRLSGVGAEIGGLDELLLGM